MALDEESLYEATGIHCRCGRGGCVAICGARAAGITACHRVYECTVEGDNISIEYRWARGDYALLPALAGELAERHVNVLVAVGGDASARAAKAAASQVPIVFTISGDPVEAGLVQSINRPGGNAT